MGIQTSKSGVKIYDNFRENLIISRYDNQFVNMRGKKIECLKSSNSEDALTWNYFKSLREINPEAWLPKLFEYSFGNGYNYPLDNIGIYLWKNISAPPSITEIQKDEGDSEIDIIIESNQFVWFLEAKYTSDISLNTKNNENRDQIIRNIDVGSYYAGVKDFYFSLIYFDENKSKLGIGKVAEYKNLKTAELKKILPHRHDSLENIKGIGYLKWIDLFKNKIKINNPCEEDIYDKLCDYIENLGIRN
ncbi:hypothetical protein AGMMS49944_08840 [Spirochaetia bacterium]|nr:hypothetical protein AGMMS49944_08840 [Spirochaetia bacterium]